MSTLLRAIKILPNSGKKDIWKILVIQIFKSFLEVLSIGMLIPLIYLLAKGESSFSLYIQSSKFSSFLPVELISSENIIFNILFLLSFIFFFKFIFMSFSSYYVDNWIEKNDAKIKIKLFDQYINDKDSLIYRNNHELINYIISETTVFFKHCIKSFVSIFFELLKILGLSLILFIFDPKVFMFVIIMMIITLSIILLVLKKKISFLGKLRTSSQELLFKYISEGLNSVKEIKLSENSNFFNERFIKQCLLNAKVRVKHNFFSVVPRYALEFLTILVISILVIYLMQFNTNQTDYADTLVALGVYMAALVKILPSISSLYKDGQNIFFSKNSLVMLEKEITEKKEIFNKKNDLINVNEINRLKDINNINIKELKFYYNKNNLVLDNINFNFEKNKIYCLIGESGSGKTTFINLLMGFLNPISGKIIYDFNDKNSKFDLTTQNLIVQKNIGYLPQKVFLLNDNVIRNIAFSLSDEKINLAKVEESLKRVNLYDHFKSLNNGLETELGDDGVKLSGGQKQRIGIARNLYFERKVLILDEFTSSLDTKNEDIILKTILKEKKDKIIIFISHSKNIINNSDTILELKNNKLIFN